MDIGFQSTIDYGGVGRFTVELLKELAPMCDQVTLYPTTISISDPESHPWWENMPENIHLADRKGLFTGAIRDTIQFQSHDLIHINYASLGMPAVISKILADVPFVYTFHYGGDPATMSSERSHQIKYWVEQMFCLPVVSKFGKIVSVSKYNRDRLPHEYDSEVVYNSGSPSMFENSGDMDVSKNLSILNEEAVILYTGKLHGFKDGETVIEGFKRAQNLVNRPLKLVLAVGSGGYDSRKIKKSIDSEDIIVLEDISDKIMSNLYKCAEVFVFPSYAESFGIVFLEAMSSKTPIIYSDEGAAPEIVNDAGLKIEARNSKQCGDKIAEMIQSRELRQECVKNGVERRRDFSWETAAQEYHEIYKDLISESDE